VITIGKLAARSGVSADTVRFYEREGLLAPAARNAARYRLYEEDALRRIRFIRRAQECGFSLADIAQLLELRADRRACCGDIRSVAVEKHRMLKERIRTLSAMSRALEHLIAVCEGSERPLDACPILGAMDAADRATPAPRAAVRGARLDLGEHSKV